MKNYTLTQFLSLGCQPSQSDTERRTILLNNILAFQNILAAFLFGIVLYFAVHPYAMWVIWAYIPFSVLSFVLAHYQKPQVAKIINVALAILYPLFGAVWFNPEGAPPMLFWVGNYYLAQISVVMLVFDYANTRERKYIYISLVLLILSYYVFPIFDDIFSFSYAIKLNYDLLYSIGILIAFTYVAGGFIYFLKISNRLNNNILKLLDETELQNQQMQAQQEELHQNMEELSAQREQLEQASGEIQHLQKVQLEALNQELNQRTEITNQVIATLELDAEGQILMCNDKFSELIQVSPEKLANTSVFNFILNANFKAELTEFFARNFTGIQFLQEEIELKTAFHKSVWISLTISPLFNTDGTIERFLAIGFSVDDIKNQQEYFRKSRENLQFYDTGLTKFTNLMRHETGQKAEDWAYALLAQLTDYLGAFQSAIYAVPQGKTQELRLLAKYCFGVEQHLPERLDFGAGIVGEVARSQEEILFYEEQVSEQLKVAGKWVRIKSVYVMPLLVAQQTEGVLILNSLENIADKSLGFLEKLAPNMAVNLAGLRDNLYIEELLHESKKINKSLQLNEETLRQSLLHLETQTIELVEREIHLKENQQMLEQKNQELEQTITTYTQELENKNQQFIRQQEELRYNTEELRLKSEKIQEFLEHETHQRLDLQSLLQQMNILIFQIDNQGNNIQFLNDCLLEITGYNSEEVSKMPLYFRELVDKRERIFLQKNLAEAIKNQMIFEQDYRLITKTKIRKRVFERGMGIYDDDGKLIHWEGILVDISNYNKLLEERQKLREHKINQIVKKQLDKLRFTEERLIHAEKLASLGQQVAGIAHEINNPISYAHNGADSLQIYWLEMKELLEKYEKLETCPAQDFGQILTQILDYKDEIEYQELKQDITEISNDVVRGTERTLEIVKSMRNFARKNTDELQETNIHESLDSTLVILKNSYKHRIEIQQNYAADLPLIRCYGGQMNQVFMNLLANAIQAIPEKGTITIKTQFLMTQNQLLIQITDTGIGMNPETQERIFEPYFTTKPINEGTGLGLPIVKEIIEHHRGKLEVESELHVGTTFGVFLPTNL